MNTNSSTVIVPAPRPADATNDIHGIKPPVEIPNGWAWAGWLLLTLVAVAALAWLWRWWQKKRNAPPPIVVIPPHVRARRKLEHALRLLSEPKLFCFEVSDALRAYLEERFQLRAPERTTEEFLYDLQATTHLNSVQKQSLSEFLTHCDLVKFARHEPTETDLRALHESALRLVDETAPYGEANPASPAPSPETPASVS